MNKVHLKEELNNLCIKIHEIDRNKTPKSLEVSNISNDNKAAVFIDNRKVFEGHAELAIKHLLDRTLAINSFNRIIDTKTCNCGNKAVFYRDDNFFCGECYDSIFMAYNQI